MTTETVAAPDTTAKPSQPPQEPAQPTQPATDAPKTAETQDGGAAADERQPIELPDGWQDAEPAQAFRKEVWSEAESKVTKALNKQFAERETQLRNDAAADTQRALATGVVQQLADALTGLGELYDPADREAQLTRILNQREYRDLAGIFSNAQLSEGQKAGFSSGLHRAREIVMDGLNKDAAEEMEDLEVELKLAISKKELTAEQAFRKLQEKRDDLIRADMKAQMEKVFAENRAAEEQAAKRNGTQPPVNNIPGGTRTTNTSDAARLDRLAYGRDSDGNPPTQADREWLAARS